MQQVDSQTRPRVLVTEGASISARHTLYALGPRHRVEVLDPGRLRLCRFSRYVRRWHRCPSYAREPVAFLSYLVEHLQRHPYDALVPTHEEIYLLSRFRDHLAPLVPCALPEFSALDRLQSKAGFVRVLEELQIPVPPTTIVRSKSELLAQREFPYFVKLAYSTASFGVWKVNGSEELQAVSETVEDFGVFSRSGEVLAQQVASGVESAAIGLFRDGELVGYHCFEEWAKGSRGMPMARVSAHHEHVRDHVRRIGEHLRWHGPLCLGYFYDPRTRQPSYIEANPRIGETVNGVPCGVNLCELWVRIARGEPVTPQVNPEAGVKTYCGFLVLLAQALDGAGRGTLARQLMDSWRQRGYFEGGYSELTRLRDDWVSAIPSTAVCSLLLAHPGAAHWIVSDTVDHYALSGESAQAIRDLNDDEVRALFG